MFWKTLKTLYQSTYTNEVAAQRNSQYKIKTMYVSASKAHCSVKRKHVYVCPPNYTYIHRSIYTEISMLKTEGLYNAALLPIFAKNYDS